MSRRFCLSLVVLLADGGSGVEQIKFGEDGSLFVLFQHRDPTTLDPDSGSPLELPAYLSHMTLVRYAPDGTRAWVRAIEHNYSDLLGGLAERWDGWILLVKDDKAWFSGLHTGSVRFSEGPELAASCAAGAQSCPPCMGHSLSCCRPGSSVNS